MLELLSALPLGACSDSLPKASFKYRPKLSVPKNRINRRFCRRNRRKIARKSQKKSQKIASDLLGPRNRNRSVSAFSDRIVFGTLRAQTTTKIKKKKHLIYTMILGKFALTSVCFPVKSVRNPTEIDKLLQMNFSI